VGRGVGVDVGSGECFVRFRGIDLEYGLCMTLLWHGVAWCGWGLGEALGVFRCGGGKGGLNAGLNLCLPIHKIIVFSFFVLFYLGRGINLKVVSILVLCESW